MVPKNDVTYYAHWQLAEYNITYDMKGHGTTPTSPTKYNITQLPITIPNPTAVPGYTFLGWLPYGRIPIGSAGDKLFTANWGGASYTIRYNPNGGSGTMDDQSAFTDEYVNLSPNEFTNHVTVTFDGCKGTPRDTKLMAFKEFLGWATTQSGVKKYNNEQMVRNLELDDDGVANLYAKWGNQYSEVILTSAVRTGYDFNKWYTSADVLVGDAGDKYGPTNNITLYAHWTAKNYTVTFNPVGGTVSPQTKSVTYDQPYGNLPPELPSSSVSKQGFDFLGWFTTSDGDVQVTSTTKVTTPNNHTLYAHWRKNTIVLTFDGNGGEFDGEDTRVCTIGQPIGTLPPATRTGYIFNNWWTDRDSGTQVTASTPAPTDDTTIYAHWTAITYKLRFNANSGFGNMNDQTLTYGKYANISPNAFYKDGCVFTGWAETSTGPAKWADNARVVNLTATNNAIINLYAVWRSDPITVRFNSNWDQYTLTFDANGGTGGYSKRIDAGTPITAPTVVRDTYNFIGWNPSVPATMPESDLTCVAQWQRTQFTITFNKQGGTGGTDSTTATYGQAMPTITVPTRSGGYKFLGYYSAANGGGTQYYKADGTSARTWNQQQDTTLYANWSNTVDQTVRVSVRVTYPYEFPMHVRGYVYIYEDNVRIGTGHYSGNHVYGYSTTLSIPVTRKIGSRLTAISGDVYPPGWKPTLSIIGN